MFRLKSLILVLVGFFALGAVAHAQSAEDAVAARSKLMRHNSAEVKAIKAAITKNDYKAIASNARSIAKSREMESFSKLFPQDTAVGNSRAKANIWGQWGDFMRKDYETQQAALALAEAADAKDNAKVAASFESLGEARNSCHQAYREPRKK